MNAKSAVISLIAIKPLPLKELVKRFPYSPPMIYKTVRFLEKEGLIKISEGLIITGDGFEANKIAEIHVASLIHGIDPEFLMRDSTLTIWKIIEENRTIREIQDRSGYSHVTVKKVLSFLERNGIVSFLKRKPIIVIRNSTDPINRLLESLTMESKEKDTFHYQGTIPFSESYMKPDEVERVLFERIEKGISIRDTGFLVKDEKGDISIIESIEKDLSLEEIFLKKLMTTEGVEDLCIRMLRSNEMNLDELVKISIDKGMSSILGCYLDILNDLVNLYPEDIILKLEKYIPKKRKKFLREEEPYGKNGWEDKYENKWNLDLYLDIDAIKHGVRSS